MPNNPAGRNQHGEKKYPPDDILGPALHRYQSFHQTAETVLRSLKRDFGLEIGLTTLNELRNRFDVGSSRKTSRKPVEEVTQMVLEAAGLGPGGIRLPLGETEGRGIGVKAVREIMSTREEYVSEDFVREVLEQYDHDGLSARFPGSGRIRRVPALRSPGFHFEWSGDGHEKLEMKALRMGGCSLPIYGLREKMVGYIMILQVVPDVRDQNEVGHVFLDAVAAAGGVPMQQTFDCGTETVVACQAQIYFRTTFAPHLSTDIFAPTSLVKSIRNTTSEATWSFLRNHSGRLIRSHIEKGYFHVDSMDIVDQHLFHWVWFPIVQQTLDEFRLYWNMHKVRPQKIKQMMSGHRPQEVADDPSAFGLDNYLIPVPLEAIEAYRATLPPRLLWYPPDFKVMADNIYQRMSSPILTPANGWEVFVQMKRALRWELDNARAHVQE
ncbi:hypothetical protein BDY24DRAFT_350095 [Mrakia frigida]|uniref:uncharacterized protein n=1 Tax=Mrakia frigida TaxID=29902 RepID=UPI003FCC1F98